MQAKLIIRKPIDKYEQEADMVADNVKIQTTSSVADHPLTGNQDAPLIHMRSLSESPNLQMECEECEEEEQIQMKPGTHPLMMASADDDEDENSAEISIQPKLQIGEPGDKYEQEADSMADRVMRMNNSDTMQMQAIEEEEESIQMQAVKEEEESLQMKTAIQKSTNGDQYASNDISQKLNSTKGSGAPLPNKVGAEMGKKIGADFSATKIHTDSQAINMNKELGAQAFTHGSDIYFNKGKYDPDSSKGKHLLAHELTHTIQQGKSIVKTKKSKLKQSSNNYIQRFPLNSTNINKLREYLSNDNESEAIAIMANLTVDEKDAVLNSREFKELAISSFGDDEMYRAMKAIKRNLYKSLEWMFDEGTNWEVVANIIRLVPDKKDVVRTDNWMKKQFVSICDNKTMAEAVDLLGGTLLEKLLWMYAEGSSWELIKEKLTNPLHIKEKTTLYGNSDMLDFFVSNRNDKEMAEAVDILGGTLLQKLTWMKAEGSNWELIKEKIAAPISATQKTDLYSKVNMRDFFVSNCNDKEMAEAVDLLGGTLLQKLNWMKAEGSNWSLVREKIRNTADAGQKTAIYGSPGMKEFFVDICNNDTIVEAMHDLKFDLQTQYKWIKEEGGDTGFVVKAVLTWIKEQAKAKAKIPPSITPSSSFYKVLKDQYLKDYLSNPTAKQGKKAVDKMGRQMETRKRSGSRIIEVKPEGGAWRPAENRWEKGAHLYWNKKKLPTLPANLRDLPIFKNIKTLPKEIGSATDIMIKEKRSKLPYIDVPFLLGKPNLRTATLEDDVIWGGKNISQLMHWATGVKYSDKSPEAMRELFLAYELLYLEGWDVFGQDALNDLIAEEQGRLLGAEIQKGSAGAIKSETDLLPFLNRSFLESRAWVGSLLKLREAELEAWILAEELPKAQQHWQKEKDYWRGKKSITQMLKGGMSEDNIKKSFLVKSQIEIYTLLYEAEQWKAKNGSIKLSELQKSLAMGKLNGIFKLLKKKDNAEISDFKEASENQAALMGEGS